MKKINQKIIALILTILLIGANLIPLGNQVIASSISSQNDKTNNNNVTFDSYLEENVHSKTYNVKEEAKLYLKLNVNNTGYLKDSVVSISNTANYEIDVKNLNNTNIVSASENEVTIKQINSGEQVIIELPIKIKTANKVESNFSEAISEVTLNANYVDENGVEREITKTINNQIIWEDQMNLNLNYKVTKYIPYNQNEEYGVLLQTVITSSIKDHVLPISKTELTMVLPQIENVNPSSVNVISNKTTNTNNDENGANFNNSNYIYEEQTGKLTITTNNTPNEEGLIALNQNGIDEYVINCIYKGKDLYEKILEKPYEAKMNVQGKVTIANTNQSTVESSIEVIYNEQETKGTLLEITPIVKNNISKGNIYANYDKKENKQETNYEYSYIAQVNELELTNKIQIRIKPDYYLDENSNEFPIENGNYIKQIKIEKSNFEKILSNEGTVQITKADGTIIAFIKGLEENTESLETVKEIETEETLKNVKIENNYIVLDISQEKLQEVQIETSKPTSVGNLELQILKAINENQTYTKDQMNEFTKIKSILVNQTVKDSKDIESTISFVEPVSKAEISISEEKQNLSTILENENVEIRVVLNTLNTENALYKNPVLEIELPNQIENVKINDVNLLLEDELKIKDEAKVIKKQGKNVIQIVLEGTQTKYVKPEENTSENIISKGANIIINANLTVNKFSASSKEQITLYYTNENTNLYENSSEIENELKGIAKTNVNIVAPTGMNVINRITGFNGENSELITLNSSPKQSIIQTHGKEQTAKIEGIITNNCEETVENVVILGKTPFKGNKTVDGENLGSTFTAPVTKKIEVTGIDSNKVKIYYTEKEEVTKDIESPENGWVENPSNLTNVKNYLIVIEGGVEKSAQITFNYEVQIPAELKADNSTYEMYKVYYDSKANETTINETKISGTLGLITENAPELEVLLTSNKPENANIPQGQVVDFTVEVKNIGKQEAKDVALNIPVPEGAVYTEYDSYKQEFTDSEESQISLKIGNIPVNETAKKSYKLKLKNVGNINNKVNISAKELSNPINSNNYVLNVIETKLQLNLLVSRDPEAPFAKGNTTQATLNIISMEDNLENVVITIDVPNGISVEKLTYEDKDFKEQNYAKVQDNKIILNIEKLEKGYVQSLRATFKVENYNGEFKILAKAVANNMEEVTSNEFTYNIENANIQITQKDPSQIYIKETDEVTFEYVIENLNSIKAENVIFTDVLPEELTIKKVQYTQNGKTIESKDIANNTAKVQWKLFEGNTTETIRIVAKANLLKDISQEKQVNNFATISAEGIESKTSNTKTVTIEYNSKLYEESNGEDTIKNYSIKGIAWLDENQNGQREETESLLPEIQVILIEAKNGETVKDITTGNEKTTVTAEDGTYEFKDVPAGDYIVIFLLESAKYNITDYQKEGVGINYNSDAISMLITLNGKQTYVGITNNIKVTNATVRNIDIGLYLSKKFDLKLDKYISKMTLTTGGETKVYNLNNSKLQKVEINKKNINNSSLIIEYKIVITNEGALPGYVRKIVDYLPKGTRFNSELNKDWYISDNNIAYNNNLENVLLNPGESKEVKLVLSTQITDDNIGKFINNNAEIYEAYNEQGAIDLDSTPANMIENEDDISKADIILGISTGSTILYVSLILAILLIITIGILIIKRKLLDETEDIGL